MQSIIIGCGRVGAGLAQSLSQRGQVVMVVDQEATGIERADGLAVVTGSDDTNVVIARLARQVFRVPRVVARLHDPRHAEVYRQLGIQTLTPLTWGIQRLSELLCYTHLNTTLSLG